ncbi:MAG: type I DNA topoisomerase [Anaerolineae bacterium]|nr:type I DNA topoisomerase [Thermoflexales bacterium]MDW8406553.1 type I DNA topoisomerase [Anaerolineae bacterium]
MEAFCFKCRGKHTLLDPKPIFFANGSPASVGVCSNCGYDKVYKMGRTPAHDGLTPPTRSEQGAGSGRASAGKSNAPAGANNARKTPLVIVESPAKARTIGKFLGRKFRVHASIGHIRDLPKNRLGVDVGADFEPRYVIPTDKKSVVKELKALAKEAGEVWLATDPDREGEAISWHLTHVLDKELNGKPVRRVEFHEITEHAIAEAFSHPRELDRNLVDAQQARRILDRLVGYTLSPLLRDKMQRKGLSAGRVQSVALRLVCEREREIERFKPVEYWTIEAELAKRASLVGNGGQTAEQSVDSQTFMARLFKLNGAEPDLKTHSDAQQVVDALQEADYVVLRVERKDRTRRPAAPFTTSTLQQEASRKLGFNARRTMAAAQQLYEGIDVGEGPVGLITYMRTDSTNVAVSAQAEAREWIAQRYGQEYLPDQPPRYTSRSKNAQEAHEAIRPTSVFRAPEEVKAYLERDQFRLYDLIWKRFIASQMANAVYDATTVDIDARPAGAPATTNSTTPAYLFRASGSIVKFPGFLKVYEEGRDEDIFANAANGESFNTTDKRLPELSENEPLDLVQLLPEQHFTQPPPRYTEASLIKALEEYGIGRPSTYATILGIIQSRYYVAREGKQLRPTELGLQVNDLLVKHFPQYIDVGFTAHVEDELDDIETGARAWQPVLHEFYDPFKTAVEQAAQSIAPIERTVEYTGEPCPRCGSPLVYKQGRFGRFIGCSNFPQCRYVEPISLPGVRCPKCGGKLVEKRVRKGRRVFYGCASYPACDFTTWNRPVPMRCPSGDGGLMVEVGKGKAKCLTCEQVFEISDEGDATATMQQIVGDAAV